MIKTGAAIASATVANAKAQIETAVTAHINGEIAKCPAGSSVKLQLMYHCDPKPLPGKAGPGKPDDWDQQETASKVLAGLTSNARLTKVYLTACHSAKQYGVVDAAMKIPSVTNVVTIQETVQLNPGVMAAVDYPVPDPIPGHIKVWKKEGQNQIEFDPIECPKNQIFDIKTNTCVPRPP